MRRHAMQLLSLVVISASNNLDPHGQQFARLWQKLDINRRYALLHLLPKGGDIHNHVAGTGDASKWLEFGSRLPGTREEFFTRYVLSGEESKVQWETVAKCRLSTRD